MRSGDGGQVLRSYGGTNPGEFFAVATEAFFTLPLPLEAEKPALYDVLRSYYRQDPAARIRSVLDDRPDRADPNRTEPGLSAHADEEAGDDDAGVEDGDARGVPPRLPRHLLDDS